jgi:hypothetical protein
MDTSASARSAPNLLVKQRPSVHFGKQSHGFNCEHRTSSSPKVDQRVTDSLHRTSDDVEKRDIRDVPTPTLSELEAIQVIRDSWELGLNDDMRFLVPMSRIKRLLDECIVGGEAGERRHAIGQQCTRFDRHWQEGDDMNPRVRVSSPGGEMEQDNSSTTWSESSDARSMTYSAYTVRSVTSCKEQISQLVWRQDEKRDSG